MSEWQPITTAPKEGIHILASNNMPKAIKGESPVGPSGSLGPAPHGASFSLTPSFDELERTCSKTSMLLQHREPGLSSWHHMLRESCIELREALRTLGVMSILLLGLNCSAMTARQFDRAVRPIEIVQVRTIFDSLYERFGLLAPVQSPSNMIQLLVMFRDDIEEEQRQWLELIWERVEGRL